ncbi:MAG: hypothetical protein LBV02_05065 [Bacteroidales bacterium]|jgi:hypothetical protein|nr:hypothetical protein [Bacteroidales bacterium]
MIDVSVRIHDKYSVEFKSGFFLEKEKEENDYSVNTWIFLPYGLNINKETYPKSHFYRDVKTYVRLFAPIYNLDEIAEKDTLPFQFLQVACNEWLVNPTEENMAELEYQIKMYATIIKSALRRESERILALEDEEELNAGIDHYLAKTRVIMRNYRDLKQWMCKKPQCASSAVYFSFGDEFLSNRIEQKCYELIFAFEKKKVGLLDDTKAALLEMIEKERHYRCKSGFELIEKGEQEKNRNVLHRLRLIRKYIENPLFLDADRKEDGLLMRQLSLILGAAVAMIFATILVFSAQLRFANFTMPFFIALVLSYILKDRVKEIANYYFSTRLSKKYFDTKTEISLKKEKIGWIKESVEFVREESTPVEVIKIRDRSDILESDNRNTAEKIILYRKLLHLNSMAIEDAVPYDISGIRDIMRFNFSHFVMKMDNPTSEIHMINQSNEIEKTEVQFIYYINFIMQLKHNKTVEYKRFRLIMSRNGIEGVEADRLCVHPLEVPRTPNFVPISLLNSAIWCLFLNTIAY